MGARACRSTRSKRRPKGKLPADEQAKAEALVTQRIETRQPAAYLTHEAWLQNVPFYVDERTIVPRSFIAELLADGEGTGTLDAWLSDTTHACSTCAPATAASR